ncbi:hypothetical protein ACOSQ4_014502 [Xanthoceras sorbifolium]
MTNVCGFNEVVLDGGASCRLLADDVRIVGEGASGLNQGIILSDKVLGPMIVKVAQDVDRNMKLKRSSWKHLARANGQDIGQANNNMALGKRVVLTNLASVGSAVRKTKGYCSETATTPINHFGYSTRVLKRYSLD